MAKKMAAGTSRSFLFSRELLNAVRRQRKIREEDGQGIPYPASWINGRRWEDEAKPDRAAMPAPDVRGGGDCGFR